MINDFDIVGMVIDAYKRGKSEGIKEATEALGQADMAKVPNYVPPKRAVPRPLSASPQPLKDVDDDF